MNAPLPASTVTVPLVVDPGALYVSGSSSASVAETLPVTTPVDGFGVPTTVVPATGAEFLGWIATLTGTSVVPPWPSLTVMVKVSVWSAAVAELLAAPCRAVAVGV